MKRVIKIGTRASIPIDGKLLLAIHWEWIPFLFGIEAF
jgi:hypothetical protein